MKAAWWETTLFWIVAAAVLIVLAIAIALLVRRFAKRFPKSS
jgi:hypothetical protein